MAHHTPNEVPIEITSRRDAVSERLKVMIEERAQKLVRFHDGIHRIEVVIDDPHATAKVEILAHVDRGPTVVAKESDAHLRVAVDRAAEKVEVQLRKLKDRQRKHKGDESLRHGGGTVEPAPGEETYDDVIRKDLGT